MPERARVIRFGIGNRNKPFCDGSHAKSGFADRARAATDGRDSAKTA
jgi:CDGSH-type Zn-finger protein